MSDKKKKKTFIDVGSLKWKTAEELRLEVITCEKKTSPTQKVSKYTIVEIIFK